MTVPRHPSASLRGRLLAASQHLRDPNFFRTVVLILEHGEGALGVVLNRPTTITIEQAAPQWSDLSAPPSVVFSGGPVERTAAVALARSAGIAPPAGSFTAFSERLGMVDLTREPLDLLGIISDLRIFSGYAGWSPGQLEDEIDAGGWQVLDLAGFDPLTPDPPILWNAARAEISAGRILQPGRASVGENN